ncbi:MAG TPA: hypothetical protein VFC14_05420 [Burkholderiales bacterium]|nr:hypothetical protein [Burkholderiales bacterium]
MFIGLALTATICCRQWAFSFDGFGGHGHTIVEIFDTASHKWRFIDVYNNIHACDARTGIPMTALEFRDALLSGYPAFNIHRNGAGRIGFPVEEKLIAYYKRGLQEWYLICGNAVFTREANVLVRRLSRLPGPLGRFISGLGERTAIQILATPDNLQRVDALLMVKRNLLIAAVALGMLLFMLIVLVCRTFVVWT